MFIRQSYNHWEYLSNGIELNQYNQPTCKKLEMAAMIKSDIFCETVPRQVIRVSPSDTVDLKFETQSG